MSARLGAVLAATLLVLAYAIAFWPGYMSFDSASQYGQALAGAYNTHHPPLMAMLWSITDQIIEGPGGLVLLHLLAYGAGLCMLLIACRLPGWVSVLVAVLLTLWPANLAILPYAWKDTGQVAFLVLAAGAIALQTRSASRWLLLLVFVALAVATAYRPLGVLATGPLAILSIRLAKLSWPKVSGAVAIVTLAVLPSLIALHPAVKRLDMFAQVGLWDVFMTGVHAGLNLVPDEVVAFPMSIEQQRAAANPHYSVPVYIQMPLTGDLLNPQPGQIESVKRAWKTAVTEHPWAYLQHRVDVSMELFGVTSSAQPQDSITAGREMVALPGQPVFAKPSGRLADVSTAWLKSMTHSLFYRPWAYLLLAVWPLWWAWQRRELPLAQLALWVAASGLLAVALLPAAAPSTTFRYMYWFSTALVMSSGLGVLVRVRRG
ncbi:MAG: hypothetical protein DHS20C11_23100 [Lysobacteraceae bacterium]|nr:MAG: hypothetical protein DHS20C11_23100 [Xanthomonadaceae bacterium]